jgi:hypothetical protein
MNKINLKGRKIGKLLVLEETRKNNQLAWKCRCDCGTECVKLACHLLSGRTKSCNCLQSPKGVNSCHWKGYNGITGAMLYRIKREALRRKLEFSVSSEQLWDRFKKQNGICAISGKPITLPTNRDDERNYNFTASLDRIDSSIGYVDGNVQWVHKMVNRMKWDLNQNEFIEWCLLISNNVSK